MDAPRAGALTPEALARRLREAGLRVTRPRLLVLALLQELGGHRSVDELVAALRQRRTPLPRASVYGIIDALASCRLITRADAGPGRALYEAVTTWHHHFVCVECGTIMDVTCVVGQKPCLRPDRIQGRVEEAQVIFRGRCRACSVPARPWGA